MTIDPTKIRVGDEVTVRTKMFNTVNEHGFIKVYDCISAINILSHTPAPRPFVVGGKVRPVGDYNYKPRTIIAAHQGILWIEALPGNSELVQASDYEPCE